MFYSANSRKGQRPPKPVEIRRPWQEREAEIIEMKRKPTHAEIVAFFQRKD